MVYFVLLCMAYAGAFYYFEPLKEMNGNNSNLSFEREFGKIIGRTDYFAYALSEKSERGITRALQSIATGIFLPF